MTHRHRSIEQILEEQSLRWQLLRSERRAEEPLRPVVTVSRLHGAGGGELARRVAEGLRLDFFDKELIQQVAESAHLGERVVAALDEKDRELLTDWLSALVSDAYLSSFGYRYHLARVVGAIARHGGAVILGRGAHLILGPGEALRVLVVAPLETRIAAVVQREGLVERDARRRIAEVEAERRAFLVKHFHADVNDPASFDLVVNTGVIGIEGAVKTVSSAAAALPVRRATLAAS